MIQFQQFYNDIVNVWVWSTLIWSLTTDFVVTFYWKFYPRLESKFTEIFFFRWNASWLASLNMFWLSKSTRKLLVISTKVIFSVHFPPFYLNITNIINSRMFVGGSKCHKEIRRVDDRIYLQSYCFVVCQWAKQNSVSKLRKF